VAAASARNGEFGEGEWHGRAARLLRGTEITTGLNLSACEDEGGEVDWLVANGAVFAIQFYLSVAAVSLYCSYFDSWE